MACQKTDVIKSVHRLCRADKRKRKQNTVYISDKHRRVEYRLSCVPEEGVGTAKNVPAFELGSVFEVMKNKNLHMEDE